MKTHYLGREEVRGYLRDLLYRLRQIDPLPLVWCPVTQSGDDVAKALTEVVQEVAPDLLNKIALVPIDVENHTGAVRLVGENAVALLAGQPVLLLDGAIHSGNMMSRCATEILRHRPSELVSYALVVKRGSVFIPTMWGVMIDDADRAFFLLDTIPNNRLDAGRDRPPLPLQLQWLNDAHLSVPAVTSGVASIDRIKWSDRRFQMEASENRTRTYVLERTGRVVGFVTMHQDGANLVIDEVAVDANERRRGYGGVLLRFADTLARHTDCRTVRLLAIREKVTWYEGFGYHLVQGKDPIRLDDEEYVLMEREVLNHELPLR